MHLYKLANVTTQHKQAIKVALTITRGVAPRSKFLIRIYNYLPNSFHYVVVALEIHIHIPVHVNIIHLYARIAVLLWT